MSPRPAVGASAWKPADFTSPAAYTESLTESHLADIDRALHSARERELPMVEIGRADFPLPGMEHELRRWYTELREGRGFLVLDRLPVERYSVEELELIFWGLGAQFGAAVSQSVMGDRLGVVTDHSREDALARAYRNRKELKPHSDFSSVVSLLCIRSGRSGGESLITSAASVHNAMLAEAPEQLAYLYRGYHRHQRGEQAPGEPEYTTYKTPVMWCVDGRIGCHYIRPYVEKGQLAAGEPLDESTRDALDTFERFVSRGDLALRFTMAPGQVLFMNNYAMLHGRTAFEDHDELERRRLLLRLWLRCADTLLPDCAIQGHDGIAPQPGRTPTFDWDSVRGPDCAARDGQSF